MPFEIEKKGRQISGVSNMFRDKCHFVHNKKMVVSYWGNNFTSSCTNFVNKFAKLHLLFHEKVFCLSFA